ncbi:MAG: ABC transporter substrate-binding protein [Clostridium sp.]
MKKKFFRKTILLATLVALCVPFVGCIKNDSKVEGDSNYEKVEFTYENGAQKCDVVVNSSRHNAITLSQFMTEMLLALGLEDRMVGTALLDNPILPEFEEAYNKIPVLKVGEGHSISKEGFLALGPDFVSGWDSSISNETTGSPEELLSKGITPFMAKSYGANATIETVYEDFELLGKIFEVEGKASDVISNMKNGIKEITDKTSLIKDESRVKVMVYDSGENDAMVVGSGLGNNLIELAGGKNIYDKDANKPYINVSWESVVANNPDVILVTDFLAGSDVQEKINFLKSHHALKDVKAIKNNNIYVVALADLSPGVRNPRVIQEMYNYFHGENK